MIGIVGGGISGLLLLHFLRERGVEAVLFEAAETPGGVMRSRTLEGPNREVAVDFGPQRVRLTPALARVVDRAGLGREIVRGRRGLPFTIYHRGRLYPVPLTPGQAVRTPLISWGGKVRALADLVTPPPQPEESIASALQRKLGREIHERLAGPILGGLYGSDPAEMNAMHTLVPMLRRTGSRRSLLLALRSASKGESFPVVSFRDGMGALPGALAALHADRIRLGAPVREVGPGAGGGLQLRTDAESLAVERVVLALPAPEAAKILLPLAPEAAAALAALRYNPLAVVPLVVPRGEGIPDVGSGFKMTLECLLPTRGVTSHHALFGREGLFTAFLGGMGLEELVEHPDAEILELARDDFERVTGVSAVPLLVHRTWMPAWDRSWKALEGLRLPAGISACSAFHDRPGVAGRLEEARKVADQLSRR